VDREGHDLEGKTLGAYRLLQVEESRALSSVYRAYQPGLNRDVMVEVLVPTATGEPAFKPLFMKYAQTVVRLRHANIVSVYDAACEGDLCYVVMESLECEPLMFHLWELQERRQLMDLEQAVYIVQQVADALDYAHQQGVHHLDLKPANIRLGPGNHVVVTEFGLAHVLQEASGFPATGLFIGTPAYQAPEQLLPNKSTGPATDVYSLGVVLYELVTGQMPYTADTPFAVMRQIVQGPIPLPRAVNPLLPKAVERVILKALAKEPAHRYATAGEMAQALARALQGIRKMQEGQGEQRIGDAAGHTTLTGRLTAAITGDAHRLKDRIGRRDQDHSSQDSGPDDLPIGVIRALLTSAFTPSDLYRFCQDRPDFRPVVKRFGPGQGLDDMVDRVIDYCSTQFLWEALLREVAKENPRQYARFEPDLRGMEAE
jgi:serine/threonine protein kinase